MLLKNSKRFIALILTISFIFPNVNVFANSEIVLDDSDIKTEERVLEETEVVQAETDIELGNEVIESTDEDSTETIDLQKDLDSEIAEKYKIDVISPTMQQDLKTSKMSDSKNKELESLEKVDLGAISPTMQSDLQTNKTGNSRNSRGLMFSLSDSPSILLSNVTRNSMKASVIYPNSTAWGNRLELQNLYNGVWQDITNTYNTTNGTYSIQNLTSGDYYRIRLTWYDNGWDYIDAFISTNSETLSISDVTANSLKISAVYPNSTAWGNRLEIHDTDNNVWQDITNTYNTTNGTYSVQNLNPETHYRVRLTWYDNGWDYRDAFITTMSASTQLTGSGTEEDPYLISDANELRLIKEDMTAHYKLAADIDVGSWEPLGKTLNATEIESFSGVLDGNGFKLKSMLISNTINDSTYGDIGFFRKLDGAIIKNITFENANVENIAKYNFTYKTKVAVLAGSAINSQVMNAKFNDLLVSGGTVIAGVIGEINGHIEFNNVDVTNAEIIASDYGGEIAGLVASGSMGSYESQEREIIFIDSSFSGKLIGGTQGGRLSGLFGGTVTKIERCSVNAEVDARGLVNGMVFEINGGSQIKDSYVNLIIKQDRLMPNLSEIYGIAERSQDKITIENCFVILTGIGTPKNVKVQPLDVKISGYYAPTGESVYVNSYYNATGFTNVLNTLSGHSRTTEQLKNSSNYINWDMANIWDMTNSYPFLRDSFDNESLKGNGTESNPYILKRREDFLKIKNNLSAYYNIESDIDFLNDPIDGIGSKDAPFSGFIDGKGHTLYNIQWNQSFDATAFFLYSDGAEFKNIAFDNIGIDDSADDYSLNSRTTTRSVSHNTNITSASGLFGTVKNSHLFNIIVNKIYAPFDTVAVGGLIGYASNSTIERCAVLSGRVSGMEMSSAASLIGIAENNTIVRECYTSMNASTSYSLGCGMIGRVNNNVLIENSYSNDTVTSYYAYNKDGRYSLIGKSYYGDVPIENVKIVNSYSSSTIEETSPNLPANFKLAPDGVVIENSYYLGNKTSSELMQKATFKNWNFNNIWKIDEGKTYPSLRNIPSFSVFLDFPVKSGEITLWYGMVDEQCQQPNPGIDIQDVENASVYSLADGTISAIKNDDLFNDYLEIDFKYNNENMRAIYFNIIPFAKLEVGRKVAQGEEIAKTQNIDNRGVVKICIFKIKENGDLESVDPVLYLKRPEYSSDYLSKTLSSTFIKNNYRILNQEGKFVPSITTFSSNGVKDKKHQDYVDNRFITDDEKYLRKLVEDYYSEEISFWDLNKAKTLEDLVKENLTYNDKTKIATVKIDGIVKEYASSLSNARISVETDRMIVSEEVFLKDFFPAEYDKLSAYFLGFNYWAEDFETFLTKFKESTALENWDRFLGLYLAQINSESKAKDVAEHFSKKFDIATFTNFKPTDNYLSSTFSDGSTRFDSEVLCLIGHSGHDWMGLNVLDLWLLDVPIFKKIEDANKLKLIIFAGCLSAEQNSEGNITESAVKNGIRKDGTKYYGVKNAIGFEKKILNEVTDNWLEAFFDAAYDGESIKDSVDKANSIWYPKPNSGVNSGRLYENENNTAKDKTISNSKKTATRTSKTALSQNIITLEDNLVIDKDNIDYRILFKQISTLLTNKYQLEDYFISEYIDDELNGNISFTLYVENVRTNIHFSFLIENGHATKLYFYGDYKKDINLSPSMYSDDELKNKANLDIETPKGTKLSKQEVSIAYLTDEDTFIYSVTNTYTDETGKELILDIVYEK